MSKTMTTSFTVDMISNGYILKAMNDHGREVAEFFKTKEEISENIAEIFFMSGYESFK